MAWSQQAKTKMPDSTSSYEEYMEKNAPKGGELRLPAPPPPPPPPPIPERGGSYGDRGPDGSWAKWLLPLLALLFLAGGIWIFTDGNDPNTVEVTVTPVRAVLVTVTPEVDYE